MANEFISPNWHVVFLHFPIALVIAGVLIEIVSFAWPRGGFRAAGRWMMLLGALLAIPTATAGIYAFRDVVTPGPVAVGPHWQEIVQQSKWLPDQWDFINNHIWLNSGAAVIAVLAVILWLGGSDDWRRRIYWPLLIGMVAAVGLLVAGAWHGGELVYRYGTGVDLSRVPDVAGKTPDQLPGTTVGQPTAGLTIGGHDVTYYIPPLQLHMVLAGFAAMFMVAAFALMLRRWYLDSLAAEPQPVERKPVTPAVTPEGMPVSREERVELRSAGPYGEERVVVRGPAKVYPGWFWLGGVLIAVGAAVAGAWSVLGVFTRQTLEQNWEELWEADERRLLLHVIFGVSIIVLSLILGFLVRFARGARGLAGILGVIVLLLIAGQVWLGALMTYDGHEGPLTGFVTVAAAAEPGEPGQQVRPPQPAGNGGGPGAAQPREPGQAPPQRQQWQPVEPAEPAEPAGPAEPTAPPQEPATPPAEPATQPAPPAPMVQERAGSPPATPQESPSGPEELDGSPREQPSTPQEEPSDGTRHEEIGSSISASASRHDEPAGSGAHEQVDQ